jgi:hypothetical protein
MVCRGGHPAAVLGGHLYFYITVCQVKHKSVHWKPAGAKRPRGAGEQRVMDPLACAAPEGAASFAIQCVKYIPWCLG